MMFDKHNCAWLDTVRPICWKDPSYKHKYDMVVIGGGAGGLAVAESVAKLGAKVAIVERFALGGKRLVYGATIIKAFAQCAKVAHQCKTASEYGVSVRYKVDFKAILEKIRKLKADLCEQEAVLRLQENLGIDVYLGKAAFTSSSELKVNSKIL